MQSQRFYPGFNPGAIPTGRYSPNQYARADPMRRHCMPTTSSNFFGSIDEGLFQARAEAAFAAQMDMKCNQGGPSGPNGPNPYGCHQQPQMPKMESVMDLFNPMSVGESGGMGMVDPHHMATMAQQFGHYGGQFGPVSHPVGNPQLAAAAATAAAGARHAAMTAPMSDSDSDPRELEAFAEHFKQRRIKLGVTQADVGKALANLKLPGVGSLSQSTICRFESLTLSHNNMIALKPILSTWLDEAEALAKGRTKEEGVLPGPEKRRKRTSIAAQEKRSLESYFQVQPRPSGDKIAAIAEKLDLKKNVVRVWFCNQRQKQKRCRNRNVAAFGNFGVGNFSPDSH